MTIRFYFGVESDVQCTDMVTNLHRGKNERSVYIVERLYSGLRLKEIMHKLQNSIGNSPMICIPDIELVVSETHVTIFQDFTDAGIVACGLMGNKCDSTVR